MTQKQGYPAKNYSVPTKRYCQTLSLKDNPALIAEYRKIHNRAESWPEIRKGIRSVGILEWEDYVARFQECVPGSTSSQKWKLMERMFYLYDE